MENNRKVKYAGFFTRAIASIIDTIILSIPLSILSEVMDENGTLYIILMVIFWWLYNSYSIYRWQGTVGKMILGLYVLDTNMKKLSFARASLRYLYSMMSYVPFLGYMLYIIDMEIFDIDSMLLLLSLGVIPVGMMLLNEKRQTLYDFLGRIIVVDCLGCKDEFWKRNITLTLKGV